MLIARICLVKYVRENIDRLRLAFYENFKQYQAVHPTGQSLDWEWCGTYYVFLIQHYAITIFVGIWEGHGWLGNKRRRGDTIGFYFNREWGQGGDPPILWEVIVYSARISSDKFFKMDRGCSERLRIVEGEGENNLVRLMVLSPASQSTGL